MPAKLPNGPPKPKLEVHFTPRELEFIELRYGQVKAHKEIAAQWGISFRTVNWMAAMVLMKLGIQDQGHDVPTALISATKKLIAMGYIEIGDARPARLEVIK
jgi:DNA-binding NarL/FixJ family response regulator